MVENWVDLLRIHEFYQIAEMLFNNVPIDDDRWVLKFGENAKLSVQSPLGITSNYNRLIRVRKSIKDLGLEEHIPEDVSEILPSHMYMRGAKHIEKHDGANQFIFGSIIFIWAKEVTEPYTPGSLNLHIPGRDSAFPSIIEAKHININFGLSGIPDHGLPQGRRNKWRSTPAVKASYVFSLWSDEGGKQNRANGPHVIGFRNYREFWANDCCKKATWDGNGFDWPVWHMKDGTTQEEIELFVARSKGIRPRNNQFFEDERDEFNYMTEYMIDG